MCPGFPRPPISPSEEYVCTDVYTVRAGDTLYSISQKYNVSVSMLMEANRILNPYNLRYGQKICIPGKKSDCMNPMHDPCETRPVRRDPVCAPEPAPPPAPVPAPPPAPAPAPAPPAPPPIPTPQPVPTPPPVEMPQPVCEGILHTIKAGDTFYMLAKQYNILLEDVLNANPGVNPYNLQIGQQVCIPVHLALPSETRPGCRGFIHKVRPGDTLYMLAKQYRTTLDDIINANPDIDCYMLKIGMELCIPTTSRQGGVSLRSPNQMLPSMPTMPTIPEIPAPEMPSIPSMPSIPAPPIPSMPTAPTMPIVPAPEMPTMPSIPAPTVPSIPGPAPTLPTIPAPMQPMPEPEETPACEGFMYTIRAGDTLYMLSRTYRVNLDTLMRANPSLDPYNLRIGMQICIPVSNNMESSKAEQASSSSENDEKHITHRIYKTQKGDTLTRILDRYKISFAALQNSNPDVDFTGNLENISLNIPSKDLYRTCPLSGAYIVKSGDTLDSISKKLLVLSDSLLMANPVLSIEDFSIPDTKICIPDQ